MRFARLVTGLRLWKQGAVALGAIGWRRAGEAPWLSVELEGGGALRGDSLRLGAEEGDALRGFLETVDSAPRVGAVGFALARFEMGCARDYASEGLSDHLLALRALLDPNGEIGLAGLPLRLAALCTRGRGAAGAAATRRAGIDPGELRDVRRRGAWRLERAGLARGDRRRAGAPPACAPARRR